MNPELNISRLVYRPEFNDPHFIEHIEELQIAFIGFDRNEVADLFKRKISKVSTMSGSDAQVGYFFDFQRLGQAYINIVFFPLYENTTYEFRDDVEEKEYKTLKTRQTFFPDYSRLQINEIRFEEQPRKSKVDIEQ